MGQKITFNRTKYNTTIINTYGADGVANTTDDLTTTYQFDNFGRTISIQNKTDTEDLGASAYKYTDGKPNETADNIKQLNRVSTAYATSSTPANLLGNSNMEAGSNTEHIGTVLLCYSQRGGFVLHNRPVGKLM